MDTFILGLKISRMDGVSSVAIMKRNCGVERMCNVCNCIVCNVCNVSTCATCVTSCVHHKPGGCVTRPSHEGATLLGSVLAWRGGHLRVHEMADDLAHGEVGRVEDGTLVDQREVKEDPPGV